MEPLTKVYDGWKSRPVGFVFFTVIHFILIKEKEMKVQERDICFGKQFVGRRKVRICNICKGHIPIGSKVANGECLGHPGIKSYLLDLGSSHPQAPKVK
jgi:hypothetical protein